MMTGTRVRLILAPYDSVHRGLRMGGGPERLISGGLEEALKKDGHQVRRTVVKPQSSFLSEVATAFELDRLVAAEVRAATDSSEFPLVLSGNCNTSVGTMCGSGVSGLGVIWLDAHADFNTPETTTTGFTDDQGLAIATGHCWQTMAASVPGFEPVPEENVVLVGSRAVEPAERERLDGSEVAVIGAGHFEPDGILETLRDALKALALRVDRVYLHLDLDVLDPDSVGPANEFAPPRGLSVEQVAETIGIILNRFTVVSAGIASYDPSLDNESSVLNAAMSCVRVLATSG